MSTSDTFFTASGSSPPAATDGESQGEAPAELVEALVQILASALVAERLPGWQCEVVPDLAGLPRVLRLRRETA